MSKEVEGLKCPSCGGNIVLGDDGKEQTYCPFCGTLLKLDTRSTEQKAYEAFKGKYKAQQEYNEAERRAQREFENERHKQESRRELQRSVRRGTGKVFGCLTPIIIVVGLIVLCVAFGPKMLDKLNSYMINPTEYIDIGFEGVNGNGRLAVTYHDDAPFFPGEVYVHSDETDGLSNGDSVQVKFESRSEEKFIRNMTKTYTVSGLKSVEKNLDNVTSDMMGRIEKSSKALLKDASGIESDEYESLRRKRLYMRYNPMDDTNYLWDVYTIHVNVYNHDFGDYVLVVEYKNAMIKPNGEFSYDKIQQVGHSKIFSSTFIHGYVSFDVFLDEVQNNKIENPVYSKHDF